MTLTACVLGRCAALACQPELGRSMFRSFLSEVRDYAPVLVHRVENAAPARWAHWAALERGEVARAAARTAASVRWSRGVGRGFNDHDY
jgi:hypothetical protein